MPDVCRQFPFLGNSKFPYSASRGFLPCSRWVGCSERDAWILLTLSFQLPFSLQLHSFCLTGRYRDLVRSLIEKEAYKLKKHKKCWLSFSLLSANFATLKLSTLKLSADVDLVDKFSFQQLTYFRKGKLHHKICAN